MRRALALAATALVLSGCVRGGEVGGTGAGGAARSHKAHELVYADGQNFTTLNPHFYTASSLQNLSALTMAYLARYGPHNEPIPELATEIPSQANGGISRDGKTLVWHLRRGVRWSDGAPFDADDVVFSTRAVLNPKNNEVGRDGWNLITKIDEPDKYTVVFHLKQPFASFLPVFFGTAGANPCLLPKHILGNLPDFNTAPYNSKPVGIGPFRYVRWRRGDAVELEANPYYWRGIPKLKRIVYKQIPDRNTLLTQLTTGELDLWPYVGQGYYDRVKAIPGHTAIKPVGYYYAHIDFNTSHPLLRDPQVRRALRFALDRATLLEKAYHGSGVLQESPISPANPVYRAVPAVPFDPAQANALLDGAGWAQRGADGIRVKAGRRLSLDYALYTGAPDTDTMVELVRGMWKAVGVEIQLRRYDIGLMFALAQNGGIVYGGKFDVTNFSWGGDPIGDINEQYACAAVPPNGQNMSRWCDRRFDADMERFKLLYDPAARQPFLDDAIGRIVDEAPTVVLYILDDIFAYSDRLTGFKPNAVTPFDNFMNVDI
ncbi:MAG: peptide ABC transporter substrate-binding protein [Candidatus Eremiobacteraeota bacterium]|nr:peptide ABC transporter substrate-binding protein [Candidatus Eremiobacteraeota bacterium]